MRRLFLSFLIFACLGRVSAAEAARWTFTLNDGQSLAKNGKGTLTDGNWVLNATIYDAAARQIWIGDGLWTGENKQTPGNAFTGKGYGTLDLTGRVADGSGGDDWTITRMAAMAFTGPVATLCPAESNGVGEYPRSVIMPTTLTAWQYKGFRWDGGSLWVTNLVVRCPEMTGSINNDSLGGHNKGSWRWVLDAPKLTTIGNIGSFCIGAKTDFDEWHVEGVTTIEGYYTFHSSAGKGTLKLPSLTSIPNGQFQKNSNMQGLELGATNAVTFIASNSCQFVALRRLALTVGPAGLDVQAGAFTRWEPKENTGYRAKKIRVLEFPWYAGSTTSVSHILKYIPTLADQKTDPCIIYAPEDFGADALVSRSATSGETPPTVAADERVLGIFTDEDGNDKAWVVHRDTAKRVRVNLNTDSNWPDDTVTVSPAPQADGTYVARGTYTFTATNKQGAAFSHWAELSGAAATNPVYTVTLEDDITLTPVFFHGWVFDFLRDADGNAVSDCYGQISNAAWTLNVELWKSGELCCGTNRGKGWGGVAGTIWTGRGSGALDLRGDIRQFVKGDGDAVTTNFLTITCVGSQAFKDRSGVDSSWYAATSVTLPTNIVYWETNPFRSCKTIRTLIANCPNMTSNISDDDLCGVAWERLEFGLPRVTSIGNQSSFSVGSKTDFSTWQLDNLTSLGVSLLHSTTGYGTLRLPSVTAFTGSTSSHGHLWRATGATTTYGKATADKMIRVELGSLHHPLATIDDYAFRGTRGLRGLSLTVNDDPAIGDLAFTPDSTKTENIRELTFPWHVCSRTNVTKILNSVPALSAQGDDPCIIWGSELYGVSDLVSRAAGVGDSPPSVAAGEKVLGIFADTNGTEKAWVVHRDSEVRFAANMNVDTRWPADSVTISPAPEADGTLRGGTTYTFTAVGGPGATFDRWEGLSGAAATNSVCTVTVDDDVTLTPVFIHDWVFDFLRDANGVALSDRNGQMSNGAWTVNMQLWKAGELSCGTNYGSYYSGENGTLWTGVGGGGSLDLRGTVRQFVKGDGETVVTNILIITRVSGRSFRLNTNFMPNDQIPSVLVMPTTITSWEPNPFRDNKVIKDFEFSSPNFTGSFYPDDFNFNNTSGRIVFDLPKLTSFGTAGMTLGSRTDLSKWNLDSATFVGYGVTGDSRAYGTLRLPSVTELTQYYNDSGFFRTAVGATSTYGKAYSNLMFRVELGSKKRPFTKFGHQQFVGARGLRGLSITTKDVFSVSNTSFQAWSADKNYSTSNIRELSFPWHVPGVEPVSRILTCVPALSAQGDDPCIIYGSDSLGALALASPATADDGTPPAVGPKEAVLGVFVDDANVRKAWVIHRPCAFARGLLILIR